MAKAFGLRRTEVTVLCALCDTPFAMKPLCRQNKKETMTESPEILTLPDVAQIVQRAKARILASAHAAIAARGRFTIALSGGSTPRPLYRALADDGSIDWSKWWIFWGDERTVPPDHAESNYRLVRETLLDHIPVQPGLVLSPTAGEFALLPAEEQALAYETALRDAFDEELPQLDLNLLGMGADGHTASLFPFTLALREEKRLFVANDVPKLNTTRLTMTYPLINASREILFLAAGAEKSEALAQVLEGPHHPEKYPSQRIRRAPKVAWLVDEAAAGLPVRGLGVRDQGLVP